MKKLLKVFSMALVLVLSLFAFACNGGEGGDATYTAVPTLNGKSTEEVYQGVVTAVESYRNNFTISIDYDISCTITAEGETGTMNMKMTDHAKFNGAEFYEKMFIDMGKITAGDNSMDLGETTIEVSVVGGKAYMNTQMDIMGEQVSNKARFNATLEQIAEYADLDMDKLINPVYDFSQHSFDDVKFFVNDNDASDVYFEMTIKGDEAKDFASNIGNEFDLEDMNTGDINYKFYLNGQGQLDHIAIEFTTSMSAMGTSMEYKYVGSIRFSDVGTTVITPPSDADTYEDLGSIESAE